MSDKKLPIALSGKIEHFGLVDIIRLIHQQQKFGYLEVIADKAEKKIFFDQGEIVYSTSNLIQDRLGESLVRAGKITQKQFNIACKLKQKDEKLGRVLVKQGFLTPGKLWVGVKNQMEEIFYSIFKFHKGKFSFYEGKLKLDNMIPLSQTVKDFILEGVEQLDELKIFVEKIINPKSIFLPISKPGENNFGPLECEIFAMIDGKKNVRSILHESQYSPFVTLNVLSKLMLSRIIVPQDLLEHEGSQEEGGAASIWSQDQEQQLEDILSRYNPCYEEIARTLNDFGVSFDSELEEYFGNLKEANLFIQQRGDWGQDWVLLKDGLIQKLKISSLEHPLQHLERELEDVLFYILFKARDFLPRELAALLLGTIDEMNKSNHEERSMAS